MNIRETAARLDTLEPLTWRGLCLLYAGGGLYEILTDSGVTLTRHVSFHKLKIPGLERLSDDKVENTDDGETTVYISESSSTDTGSSNKGENSDQDTANINKEGGSSHKREEE